MKTRILFAWLCAASAGCGNGGGGAADGGGGADAGRNRPASFDPQVLDPDATERLPLAIAQRGDKLGVAYFTRVNATDFAIKYLEWEGGTVSRRSTVQTVQRVNGVSVAFDPSGSPAVAYLGGGADLSQFWLQSDAVVAFGTSDGGWREEVAVTLPDEAPSASPVSNDGVVVGVYPALVFEGPTAQLAYRDVGGGQFPTDWQSSDIELATRTGVDAYTPRVVLGGETKLSYGGHLELQLGGGELGFAHDRQTGNTDFGSPGNDVIFSKRLADGGFTAATQVMTAGNTQTGPSLAYDPTVGWAVAVVDRTNDTLYFTQSSDGATWTLPDPAFQSGSGGFWPSLSIDPATHDPSIAFYFCGLSTGLAEVACPAGEDELRVLRRLEGNWREALVDEAGGYLPQLAHLSGGQRVVVYRDPQSGALKLATEK